MNTLYYGDNLKILREYIKDETVDLVYLDPPFNSNRNYNVLFKDESGKEADAQITAFEDTWHWTQTAEETYHDLLMQADEVSQMIEAFRKFIGTNQMLAYLVMMTARLAELHRVLKPTGSLYLHCDPTASHYLKILLDTIFGAENFRNEIIWQRTKSIKTSQFEDRKFGVNTDTIFFYTKTNSYLFKSDVIKIPFTAKEIEEHYPFIDEKGRFTKSPPFRSLSMGERPNLCYEYKGYSAPNKAGWKVSKERLIEIDEAGDLGWSSNGIPFRKYRPEHTKGRLVTNLWTDIELTGGNERLGYPTQKPVALLERIVQASSNEGDVVLDPFCGCGTTIAAAQKLNRQWIGIDVTHLSIALQKYRLKDAFGLEPKGNSRSPHVSKDGNSNGEESALADARASDTYQIIGEPEDLNSARQLALEDRYQFQWWALSLIKARPLGASAGSKTGKKGSDKGIDGVIVFTDDNSGKAKRVLVQVKSGKVKSGDIRDLVGTITREEAAIGVFITLEEASRDMKTEAASAGYYHSGGWNRDYPRLQILTIEELLNNKEVQMPPNLTTFKQAGRIAPNDEQNTLF